MARGPKLDSKTQAMVDQFVRMPVGRSFFVPDAKRVELEFLRRPAVSAGAGIRIVHVELDEIYQQPGVRVWREEGPYDEL